MRSLNVNINRKSYIVEHPVSTINIYRIIHPYGFCEVTRNRISGKWKVLLQEDPAIRFPLVTIGKAIERNLGIIN